MHKITEVNDMRIQLKNNSEVAHIWAQQKQATGKGSHMFFEGKSIYSYGHHFEMARFIKDNLVFVTSREYSSTTRKHKHYVRVALNCPFFIVPSFDDHELNLNYLYNQVVNQIDKTNRAHKYISYNLAEITKLKAIVYRYYSLFKGQSLSKEIRKKINQLDKYDKKVLSQNRINQLKEREKIIEKRNRLKDEERQARYALEEKDRLKRALEDLEKWRLGVENIKGYFYTVPIALRIKDNEVQTSRGASISLNVARKLWEKMIYKQPVHGMELDHYTVTSLNNGILKVGCHDIPVSEIYRLAKQLNWLETSEVIL